MKIEATIKHKFNTEQILVWVTESCSREEMLDFIFELEDMVSDCDFTKSIRDRAESILEEHCNEDFFQQV